MSPYRVAELPVWRIWFVLKAPFGPSYGEVREPARSAAEAIDAVRLRIESEGLDLDTIESYRATLRSGNP